MFVVYVLYNSNRQTYTGYSANFDQRFLEHNNPDGKKRGWTRLRGPWNILLKEVFTDKKTAILREKKLKTGFGRDYIKKLLNEISPG